VLWRALYVSTATLYLTRSGTLNHAVEADQSVGNVVMETLTSLNVAAYVSKILANYSNAM